MADSRPPVSAAAIERAFLAPSMDGRAHNLDQYDPSPGVDSSLERIRALALRLPPGSEREALIAEVDEAIASNCREAEAELAVSGAADQLVADLRHIERSGQAGTALGAKSIARALRQPLECMTHPDGRAVAELVAARDQLHRAVAEAPLLMLLSSAVERELGGEKFTALRELAEKDGAARSAPAGTVEERRGARHGEL